MFALRISVASIFMRPLLVPDTTAASHRPPPRPAIRPAVLCPEDLPRTFEEAAKEPSPDSSLGLLGRYHLALKPFQPKDPTKRPIPPPSPSKLSGFSAKELQLYLNWVVELAETEGLEKAKFQLATLIEPEEGYIQAVYEALEQLYAMVLSRYEVLHGKYAKVQALREQVRREIEAFLEFSSPEQVAQALHDGREYTRQLHRFDIPVNLRHPSTLIMPLLRRMARRRLEECLEVFRFDDIEAGHRVTIHDVGNGKEKAPSFTFIPGTEQNAVENAFPRISQLLTEVYEDAPSILEKRMRQLASLRGQLYRLECRQTQDSIAAVAANVASRTQQPLHSQPQPAAQIQI